jgi:serine/threonine-protein kinase
MSLRRVADPAIKILDWGLARVRPDAGGTADSASMDLDAEKGALIGTADYIAPEQARDPCLVDIRADIYSLGCTLYFLLTGQTPFRGGSLMQKLLQHRDAERPHMREVRADVPEELAAIVKRMMARLPEDRYAIPMLAAAALRPFAANTAKRHSSSTRIVRPKKPSTAVIDLSAHASSEPEA